MNDFDLLQPSLQYYIVNSLAWQDLRPFQKAVIRPILEGRHLLILAPTAGGKTEAALFPVMSRMLEGDWRRLSILYICPIKALLNNLEARLGRYFNLLPGDLIFTGTPEGVGRLSGGDTLRLELKSGESLLAGYRALIHPPDGTPS